jgi:Tetratricopeptide repeat
MGDIKTYNIGNIGTAQFVIQSLDYQKLTRQIEKQQKYVKMLQADGQTEEAIRESAELAELEQQLEQFKADVLRLYETFTKIEINTERLAQAKAYFDQGQFREADAILNAAAMAQDLDRLIARDEELAQQTATVRQQRSQLADEYVIKARLWATFYDQPNRFEQTCEYFEAALRAAETAETQFEYAKFLQEHNCFNQAKPLYESALQHYRTLAEENPRSFLPDVAGTLNNLAILQAGQNDYGNAQRNYEEALQIRRTLVEENPRSFLPYVATTLNNLAILQKNQNDYGNAQRNYEEALQIRRTLAEENPRSFLPDVAMTLINLSCFYLEAIPHPEQSIKLATEALEILQDFQGIAYLDHEIARARRVLQENGVEPEAE